MIRFSLRTNLTTTIDPFEPVYSPRKIEFWLAHWEELVALVMTPKSSAHIAEHLNREWVLLQPRLRYCLCHETHAIDSRAVDPACTHESTGGTFRKGGETVLCVYADLIHSAASLPPHWIATRKIWREQMIGRAEIEKRLRAWNGYREREPAFSRTIAVNRMAKRLGWKSEFAGIAS